MRIKLRAPLTIAALLAGAQGVAAQSGYASSPFREYPVELAQAAAIERLEVAARALAVQTADTAGDEDEEKEEAAAGGEADEEEAGPAVDFALFRATLAAASPELEQKLAAAMGEMFEASESGESATEPAGEVVELAEKARDTLLAAVAADNPGFRAALMASLLLDEGGVAESYEQAVEGEASAYARGRFALQRVKALWEGLKADTTPERADDVETMLALLDGLFPTEAMPEHMSPDPEQAEAPAQQLVGLSEAVANADLYPGRDLAGAARVVREIAASGCSAIAEQKRDVGVERIRVASAYYAQTVEATLDVMAPDTASAIADGLEALQDEDADPAACDPLLDAFEAGQKRLMP